MEMGRFEFTSTVNAKMEMPTWELFRGVTGTRGPPAARMLPGGCPTFRLDNCSSRSSGSQLNGGCRDGRGFLADLGALRVVLRAGERFLC